MITSEGYARHCICNEDTISEICNNCAILCGIVIKDLIDEIDRMVTESTQLVSDNIIHCDSITCLKRVVTLLLPDAYFKPVHIIIEIQYQANPAHCHAVVYKQHYVKGSFVKDRMGVCKYDLNKRMFLL